MKFFKFIFWALLIVVMIIIGKAAIKKDGQNRATEDKQKQVESQKDTPPAPVPLGSKWNPLPLTHVINGCAGVFVINPGDSVYVLLGDPRSIGYSFRYSDPDGKIRVTRINNGRTLKVLEETPGKKISKSKMDGIDRICVKNLGEEEVRLYSWYGYKSAATLAELGGF